MHLLGFGMAVGAGFLLIPIMGIPVTAIAAFLFRPRREAIVAGTATYTLIIRIGAGHQPDALLSEVFGKHLESFRLQAARTARQGAAVELTYAVRLRAEDVAVTLVGELNRLEGVQEVELRQA